MTCKSPLVEHAYIDPETGNALAYKERWGKDHRPSFSWRQPDGTPGLTGDERKLPLYNAHLLKGLGVQTVVVFVEGEKAADALATLGVTAVCLPGGASARPSMLQLAPLAGRRVALWPDRDSVGRGLMRRVYERLRTLALEIRAVYPDSLTAKDDAFDWVQQGHTREDLIQEWERNRSGILIARNLDIVSLAEIEERDVQWLWPNYIPFGMLTMIEGAKGSGKSFITMKLACMLSVGDTDLPVYRGTYGSCKTLVLAHEDPHDTVLKPRVRVMGGDPENIKVIRSSVDAETGEVRWIDLKRDLDTIEAELENDDYAMLVIDPINNYLSESVNTYSDHSLRTVLSPLADVANRTGVAILGIRHFKKSRDQEMIDWGNGSGAYGAVARMVHGVLVNPNDRAERLLYPIATNIAATPPPIAFSISDENVVSEKFEWLGARDLPMDALLDAVRTKSGGQAKELEADRRNGVERLLEARRRDPPTPIQVSNELNIERAVVQRIIYSLGHDMVAMDEPIVLRSRLED